jgi:hypothetical protein
MPCRIAVPYSNCRAVLQYRIAMPYRIAVPCSNAVPHCSTVQQLPCRIVRVCAITSPNHPAVVVVDPLWSNSTPERYRCGQRYERTLVARALLHEILAPYIRMHAHAAVSMVLAYAARRHVAHACGGIGGATEGSQSHL